MKPLIRVTEYVAKMEALGFRFRANRRANRRELSTTFPVIWPVACDEINAEFGAGREAEVFDYIARRDGVISLPPISDVARPDFGARSRPTRHDGGSAA